MILNSFKTEDFPQVQHAHGGKKMHFRLNNNKQLITQYLLKVMFRQQTRY